MSEALISEGPSVISMRQRRRDVNPLQDVSANDAPRSWLGASLECTSYSYSSFKFCSYPSTSTCSTIITDSAMSGHIPLFHRDDRQPGGLNEPAPPQRPIVGIRQFPLLNTQFVGAIGLPSEDGHKSVDGEKGEVGGREGRRCVSFSSL